MTFAAVTLSVPTSALAEEKAAPQTVPSGVTLVEVVRELNASAAQLLWVRLGDADGSTLMFLADGAPGGVACIDKCAVEFPPLPAPADAEPFARLVAGPAPGRAAAVGLPVASAAYLVP